MFTTHPYSFFKYKFAKGALLLGGLFVFFILNANVASASPSTPCPWSNGDNTLLADFSLFVAPSYYDCTGVNLTIPNGIILTMGSNPGLGQYAELRLANLTIESGGAIESNGLGYGRTVTGNGVGTGGGTCSGASCGGGSHGGAGGSGSSGGAGGPTYGDANAPVTWGSSGGGLNAGSNGGGIVHIVVTEDFINNGTIDANGVPTSSSAGGAGGSIYITADTTAGNGHLWARGANGYMAGLTSTGGGGGGRIAVVANTYNDSFAYSVAGGIRAGSVGGSNGIAGTIVDGPPRVIDTDISPAAPAFYEAVTLYAQAKDYDGIDSITVYLDSAAPGSEQEVCDTAATVTGDCTLALANVSPGTHQMVVRVVDENAVSIDRSYSFTVTGDSGGSQQQACNSPRIELSSPNGGESFVAGSTQSVLWSAVGCSVTGVRLSLSTDSGQTYGTHIADVGNAAGGFYSWIVPSNIDSSTARLRAELLSGGVVATDESSADFTIGYPIVSIIFIPEPQTEPVDTSPAEPGEALVAPPIEMPMMFTFLPPQFDFVAHEEAVEQSVQAVNSLSAVMPDVPVVSAMLLDVQVYQDAREDFQEVHTLAVESLSMMVQDYDVMDVTYRAVDSLADVQQFVAERNRLLTEAMIADGIIGDNAADMQQRVTEMLSKNEELQTARQQWDETVGRYEAQMGEVIEDTEKLLALQEESVVLSDILFVYQQQLFNAQTKESEAKKLLDSAQGSYDRAKRDAENTCNTADMESGNTEILARQILELSGRVTVAVGMAEAMKNHSDHEQYQTEADNFQAEFNVLAQQFESSRNQLLFFRNLCGERQQSAAESLAALEQAELIYAEAAAVRNEIQMTYDDARMIQQNKIRLMNVQQAILTAANQAMSSMSEDLAGDESDLNDAVANLNTASSSVSNELYDPTVPFGLVNVIAALRRQSPELSASVDICMAKTEQIYNAYVASLPEGSLPRIADAAEDIEDSLEADAFCNNLGIGRTMVVNIATEYSANTREELDYLGSDAMQIANSGLDVMTNIGGVSLGLYDAVSTGNAQMLFDYGSQLGESTVALGQAVVDTGMQVINTVAIGVGQDAVNLVNDAIDNTGKALEDAAVWAIRNVCLWWC